jgi:hypothetical protein
MVGNYPSIFIAGAFGGFTYGALSPMLGAWPWWPPERGIEMTKSAQEIFAAMPVDLRRQFEVMWRDTEERVIRAQPNRSKEFEVHHAIAHARNKFLAAMVDGKGPVECQWAAGV